MGKTDLSVGGIEIFDSLLPWEFRSVKYSLDAARPLHERLSSLTGPHGQRTRLRLRTPITQEIGTPR